MKNTLLTNRDLQEQRGFTLVEILVALTLGLLVTATILQIFLSSKQAYLTQEQSSRIQENGNYALELLSRYIRMAGYIDNNPDNIRGKNSFSFTSTQVAISMCGQNNQNFAGGQVIAGINGNDSSKGDCIVIRYHGGDDGSMVDCFGSNTTTQNGQEQKIDGGQTIVNAIYVETDATNGLALSCESRVLNMLGASIETSSLQAFAPGVENIQIRYGVNAPGGPIDANNVADWSRVVSVQIALLVSSDQNVTTQHQSYVFPPWSTTTTQASDFKLRRVFTTTINLRNQSQNFHIPL